MSIEYTCACGRNYFFRDRLAGRRIRCQACGAEATVPSQPDGGPAAQASATPLAASSGPQPPHNSPHTELPTADPRSAEALSAVVYDEESMPHLRRSVLQAEARKAVTQGHTAEGFLSVAIATAGMVAVLLGAAGAAAGALHLAREGINGMALAALTIVVSWTLGVGGGLALMATGMRGGGGGRDEL